MFFSTRRTITYRTMVAQYGKQINKENIQSIRKREVKKILINEKRPKRDLFLQNTIAEWADYQIPTKHVLYVVRKLLRKYDITLNKLEEEKMFLYEAAIFGAARTLKQLDVNIHLRKREAALVKYDNVRLFKIVKTLKIESKGELIVTNRRIIIVNKNERSIASKFSLSKVHKLTHKKDVVMFTYNSIRWALGIYDNKVLFNVLKNVINKKVK